MLLQFGNADANTVADHPTVLTEVMQRIRLLSRDLCRGCTA